MSSDRSIMLTGAPYHILACVGISMCFSVFRLILIR